MAARSRGPRPGPPKEDGDAHEERDLFAKIQNALQELTRQSKRQQELTDAIAFEAEKLAEGDPTIKDMEYLQKLYQEQYQLSEKEHMGLMTVLELNDLLIALRTATESGDRGGPNKRKRNVLEGISADSPSNRTQKVARSNSAAPTNDLLQLRSEVAFRQPKQRNSDGEWILCIVVAILGGEGNKRKYEVEDPEPDQEGGHAKYKASASALIPIPKESAGLPQYPNGKQVLARYPETTTFYRAEVIGTKRDGTCRLKFEGEEEVGKETEVERRLVLDFGDRKM